MAFSDKVRVPGASLAEQENERQAAMIDDDRREVDFDE